MQTVDFITSEHQLGSKLAYSIENSEVSTFAWLLASLSTDALDFSQFSLIKTPDEAPLGADNKIRQNVGPKRELAPSKVNFLIGTTNRAILSQSGLDQLRLIDCLSPEPLSVRDDPKYVGLEIIHNCSPAVQSKHFNSDINIKSNKINTAGLYQQLADEKINAPLVNRYQ